MPLLLPGEESAINAPGSRFDRHHHARPYAALVIRGTCDEAGDRGRFRAEAGDVLVHAAFDAHGDRIGHRGAAFINFPLDSPLDGWFGQVPDIDAIVRTHARDPREASAMLRDQFRPVDGAAASDWPDLLADSLGGPALFPLAQWADRHRLHPASVSRGFRQAYGVSPKRYRLERIASRAARRIAGTRDSFGVIAADCGFADQAHMTRAIVQMFRITPGALRVAS